MDEPTTVKPEPVWLDECGIDGKGEKGDGDDDDNDDEDDDDNNDEEEEEDDMGIIEEEHADSGQRDEIPDPRQFLQVDIKLEPDHLKSEVEEGAIQDWADDSSEETDEDPLHNSKKDNAKQPTGKRPANDENYVNKANNTQLKDIDSGVIKAEQLGKGGRIVKLVPWFERPFVCNLCGRRFSQRSGLKSHMYTHTGEKPYSCPQCHRSFSHRTHVTRHMLTHTGLKPHSCSLCNRQFSLRSNLIKHMITHSGEKPYTCATCNRSFAQRFNLNTHMSTHSRDKPFACPFCHRKYSHRSSLAKHVLTHETVKCDA